MEGDLLLLNGPKGGVELIKIMRGRLGGRTRASMKKWWRRGGANKFSISR